MRGGRIGRWTGLLLVFVAGTDTAGSEWPPLPPERPAELGGGPAGSAADAGAGDLPAPERDCRDRLAAKGIVVDPLPPIRDGACGAAHPVRVSRVAGGVALGTPGAMTCILAEALANWAGDGVAPAALERLGRTLVTVQVGTTYECRGQNRDPAARLSEHAFANGADIAGFAFSDGKRLPVGTASPTEAEAAFLAAVREAACKAFTTVLGPGAEGHADHMHVDMRARPGGYRICQ